MSTAPDVRRSKYEWMVTGDWARLHYVPGTHDDEWWDEATDAGIGGTAACGLTATWTVPGVFSRMGCPRCALCCRAIGIPRGDGAPINDPQFEEAGQ